MKIFADKHHESLTKSLQMLFEGRLGHELYTPIGIEWYPDYWKLNDIEATARQFLEAGSQPYIGYPMLEHDRGITLDQFKEMKFDILIASIPQHIEPFKDLIRRYQPDAKLIFQIGNKWEIPNNAVKNVMASAICTPPIQVNFITYHQEFDLKEFFYTSVPRNKKIYSFIHCLPVVDLHKEDWELFLQLEKLLPDWEFKSFGGQCRDGWVGKNEVADKIREADYIYMVKSQGDGYGHNIFNAAACGRPLITRLSDYKNKLAEPLIEDGITAITVDGRTPEEIASRINNTDAFWLGNGIHHRFEANVNFDEEERRIRKFIDNLL